MNSTQKLYAFTDASVTYGNHGAGAIILVNEDAVIKQAHLLNFGTLPRGSNNNHLELRMQIAALNLAPAGSLARIYSDNSGSLTRMYKFQQGIRIKRVSSGDKFYIKAGFDKQGTETRLLFVPRKEMGISISDEFCRLAAKMPCAYKLIDLPDIDLQAQLDWLADQGYELPENFSARFKQPVITIPEGTPIQSTSHMPKGMRLSPKFACSSAPNTKDRHSPFAVLKNVKFSNDNAGQPETLEAQ